jgi:hypothetical protein
MASHAPLSIPDTGDGRAYRGRLMLLGVSSIVGMADQFRAMA